MRCCYRPCCSYCRGRVGKRAIKRKHGGVPGTPSRRTWAVCWNRGEGRLWPAGRRADGSGAPCAGAWLRRSSACQRFKRQTVPNSSSAGGRHVPPLAATARTLQHAASSLGALQDAETSLLRLAEGMPELSALRLPPPPPRPLSADGEGGGREGGGPCGFEGWTSWRGSLRPLGAWRLQAEAGQGGRVLPSSTNATAEIRLRTVPRRPCSTTLPGQRTNHNHATFPSAATSDQLAASRRNRDTEENKRSHAHQRGPGCRRPPWAWDRASCRPPAPRPPRSPSQSGG